jgi:alkyl hydroperoxide reductase 1
MAPLKVGDSLPEGVKFEYVHSTTSSLPIATSTPRTRANLYFNRWAPITDADPTACGRPQEYDASKEWADKKVVLFSVPGAFTPGFVLTSPSITPLHTL